jgi:hypothetical protein
MKTIGKYCKAYLLNELYKYPKFKILNNIDKDYVFLQDNYTVTADIYKDESILYDDVDDQWIDYCKESLHFYVPD